MLLFRPRRYDAVSARISDGLAEVLMLVTEGGISFPDDAPLGERSKSARPGSVLRNAVPSCDQIHLAASPTRGSARGRGLHFLRGSFGLPSMRGASC